jgi:hypothetical protein
LLATRTFLPVASITTRPEADGRLSFELRQFAGRGVDVGRGQKLSHYRGQD